MARIDGGGKLITISERKPAMIVCGRCNQEILIDITPFAVDVSNIMVDKCPKCGGKIHVGILIIGHPEMKGLLHCIKMVVNALNPGNLNLIG